MKSSKFRFVFTKKVLWFGLLVILALAACQGDLTPQVTTVVEEPTTVVEEPTTVPTMTSEPMAEASPTVPAPEEAVINVATDPTLGPILVGTNGMTLYMFTKDEPGISNCTGACLENWPPLLTQGNPVLGEGIDPTLVGTATLADGSLIVTYNSMPLYYFIDDLAPGDVTGQDVSQAWFVIAPDGNPVGIPNSNTNSNTNGNANDNDNSNSNSNSNENSNDDDNGNGNGGG